MVAMNEAYCCILPTALHSNFNAMNWKSLLTLNNFDFGELIDVWYELKIEKILAAYTFY